MDQQYIQKWQNDIQKASIQATPYMLVDLDVIRDRCRDFKVKFPSFKLYYAMKALSDGEVIKAVDSLVDGYDAASIKEVLSLIENGVQPDRIAFSNPVKPDSHVMQAAQLGVKKFAFQTEGELDKIAHSAPNAEVYVRVKMDDAHSTVPLSVKFGCDSNSAVDLLEAAKRKGLRPIGVNFHTGSQQTDFSAWSRAIRASGKLMREARNRGLEVSVINIGGGFPAPYSPDAPAFDKVASSILPSLNELSEFTYMVEPGRFIVAESAVIVARVIGVEDRDGKTWAYLDVGMFQAFLGAQRFSPFPYQPLSLRHAGQVVSQNTEYLLAGPSCDSQDVICDAVTLPADLSVGDELLFPNTGAYTVVYGSEFNGFEVPKRHFLHKDSGA